VTVCFVDTETTGLDPDRHPIWNVALIEPDGHEWEWFLPVDLTTADAVALNIGRYHDRHPSGSLMTTRNMGDRPRLTDVGTFARDFARITWGAHLAGAVVSFDEERLRRLLRANGVCPGWHYHIVDVEALAAGWLAHKWGGLEDSPDDEVRAKAVLHKPPWNSTDLSRAVGVHPENFERHTAVGDARWAKAIYTAVMG